MKRLWAASALLAVLLGVSLLNAWYSKVFTEKMAQELEQACQMARDDDWEGARQLTWAVYQDWQGKHFYLHTVMRHGDTNQILRSFQGVLQYLQLEEMDQYAAANADLASQLRLLSEMEQASLVNIL